MERKKLLLIIGLVVLFILIGSVVLFKIKGSRSLVGPIVKESETSEELTWEDPAGFNFLYPKEIKIDPHEEDEENYAHLELTSDDHSGKILVWVKETEYTDIEDWLEEEIGEEEQVFDTELDTEPAKKIAFADPEKLVVAAIDVDSLVLLEMYPDEEDYWQEVYSGILDTFTFIPLEGEETDSTGWQGEGGAGGIIEEPEEVIE
ncbi:hypothetical protein A2Z41_03290 [Microgenomates group bacterium RBG_19FT_COMBO_39_10]|nr:MAG: hypothetical protein A2Z41_03290 [Microgenomates group bacterium RBG_19FT_COMBO_39_10]